MAFEQKLKDIWNYYLFQTITSLTNTVFKNWGQNRKPKIYSHRDIQQEF